MTENPKVEEKNDDTMVHVEEAASILSSVLTLVGFIFPVARVGAAVVGVAGGVLKYFNKGKKHE